VSLWSRESLIAAPRATTMAAPDQRFYDAVAEELRSRSIVDGLWVRSFSEASGDEAKARAIYIAHRVEQLKAEEAAAVERAARQEQERRESAEREPPPPTEPRMRVGLIVRDVVIVWVLTAIGGCVAGVATGGPGRDAQQYVAALAISNILLGTVAFTIAGCLAPPGRWRHLGFVALGTWIGSLINVVFLDFTIWQWLGGAILLVVMMAIGGGISYVLKRDTGPLA
jgi:hypothetical protein